MDGDALLRSALQWVKQEAAPQINLQRTRMDIPRQATLVGVVDYVQPDLKLSCGQNKTPTAFAIGVSEFNLDDDL
ncbi:hypothetical protein ACQJ02_29055, partial [Pseudomonas zeae]